MSPSAISRSFGRPRVGSRSRQWIAPLYLFLCLVLGGSSQAIFGNMLLRLLGLAILAWAAMSRKEEPLLPPARQLLLLGMVGLAVVALQLIPLPASTWAHLGG